MASIRPPAVAGTFYPFNPAELRRMVDGFLAEAQTDQAGAVAGSSAAAGRRAPKALIAPHAGYVYSGPVAASAYVRLAPLRGKITRVVLLGPSHRVGFRGLALSSADYFDTPLGRIALDKAAQQAIAGLPQVQLLDAAHALEHSLEVQLPFLQQVLGVFQLVPLVVGDARAEQVAEVLERLWGGEDTLIVVSSDLSHYHDYATAQRLDRATSHSIERLRYEDLHEGDACGRAPVSGLLRYIRGHGGRLRTVDLRNSGDTAGPRDQVVGYGAYVLE
jgi:AmmeMemoRadiSam system protein B